MNFFDRNIYLLGIGGVSMSALAVFCKAQGANVAGYDERAGQGTKICQKNGIEVDFSVNEKRIAAADLVVASSAIKADDVVLLAAKKHKKKIITRGQLLGEISSGYENVIAVAGSHGKTTTTAMIFEILCAAGLQPTLHLGGYRSADGKNFCIGQKEYFVTEACEYHNNFLYLYPTIGVVTNLEKEHMDFFKTFENQVRSFKKFKSQSRFVIDSNSQYCAKNLCHDNSGGLIFDIFEGKKKVMHLHMHICEEVNAQNAIYAYMVAKKLGIADCVVKSALQNFKGVGTRFERMKCPSFDVCICDYAHHPTEISKAIETAKKVFNNKTLVTVFQPHTFSRTKTLLPQFISVFQMQQHVVLFKTYSAREQPCEGLSAKQLADILQKQNKTVVYADDYQQLLQALSQFSKTETALLFVGAGDLPQILKDNAFVVS